MAILSPNNLVLFLAWKKRKGKVQNVSRKPNKILSEGDANLDGKMITSVRGSGKKYTHSNAQISEQQKIQIWNLGWQLGQDMLIVVSLA